MADSKENTVSPVRIELTISQLKQLRPIFEIVNVRDAK